MKMDLIKQEQSNWLREFEKEFNWTPSEIDWINFYKKSIYLKEPFKIFEKYFKVFWKKMITYPWGAVMYEERWKVMMFNDCIKFLRADFDLYYKAIGSSKKYYYEINKEQNDDLEELVRKYFGIPDLIIMTVKTKSDAVKKGLGGIARPYPLKFMKKIKEIETSTKPKLKQDQAIIEANRILDIFNESDLINQDGSPTELLNRIKMEYKRQKKFLEKYSE